MLDDHKRKVRSADVPLSEDSSSSSDLIRTVWIRMILMRVWQGVLFLQCCQQIEFIDNLISIFMRQTCVLPPCWMVYFETSNTQLTNENVYWSSYLWTHSAGSTAKSGCHLWMISKRRRRCIISITVKWKSKIISVHRPNNFNRFWLHKSAAALDSFSFICFTKNVSSNNKKTHYFTAKLRKKKSLHIFIETILILA